MAKDRSPTIATQISLFASKEPAAPFRKAVQVLHSLPKAPLSLLQRKVANAWLKNAIENEPEPDGLWEMSVHELSESTGFDSKNSQYLRDTAQALQQIQFVWDVLAPQGRGVDWESCVMFPTVQKRGSLLRYEFHSRIRAALLNPEIYALIDMHVVRRFRRASSLAIWEHCVRFEKIGQTAEVEWEKFRDMVLGESADADTYKEYKYFKAKVLKPSVAEINAESQHIIELIETRQGKWVKGLRFSIAKKVEAAPQEVDDDRNLELVGEMVKLGILQSEARKLCASNSFEDLKGAIEYTKRRVSNKTQTKVENVGAYLRKALSDKYKVEDAKVNGAPHVNVPVVDVKAQFDARQVIEARAYFKELDTSDQAVLIERYNEQQGVGSLKVKKRASLATEASFFRWLARVTWGEPSAETLLAFAQEMLGRAVASPGAA